MGWGSIGASEQQSVLSDGGAEIGGGWVGVPIKPRRISVHCGLCLLQSVLWMVRRR